MAINYWDMDDEDEVTGEYVVESGGDFPVIPHGTRVACFIDEAKTDKKQAWDKGVQNADEEDCIKLRFEITEPDDYARQKLFKTFWTETGGDEKLKRDKKLFMNIDKNAGGHLMKLKRDATDEDLQRHLVGKQMMIIVGLMDNKKDKPVNYIMGVSAANGGVSKQSTNTAKAVPKKPIEPDDSDIPF